MTEMTSGCGGSPQRSVPAERTGIVTPSAASRRASSETAIVDRHTFAVHSTRMPALAGGGPRRCWNMRDAIFVIHLDYRKSLFVHFSCRSAELPQLTRGGAGELDVHSVFPQVSLPHVGDA
jgi:hypothetical protein